MDERRMKDRKGKRKTKTSEHKLIPEVLKIN
jgi:hypothetical protein